MRPDIEYHMLQYIFDVSDVKCSAESSNGERWRRIFSPTCVEYFQEDLKKMKIKKVYIYRDEKVKKGETRIDYKIGKVLYMPLYICILIHASNVLFLLNVYLCCDGDPAIRF